MTRRLVYNEWVAFLTNWYKELDVLSNILGIDDIFHSAFGKQFEKSLILFFDTFEFTEDMANAFSELLWSEDGHILIYAEETVLEKPVPVSINFDDFYNLFVNDEDLN